VKAQGEVAVVAKLLHQHGLRVPTGPVQQFVARLFVCLLGTARPLGPLAAGYQLFVSAARMCSCSNRRSLYTVFLDNLYAIVARLDAFPPKPSVRAVFG
jgi:hypothetical protein